MVQGELSDNVKGEPAARHACVVVCVCVRPHMTAMKVLTKEAAMQDALACKTVIIGLPNACFSLSIRLMLTRGGVGKIFDIVHIACLFSEGVRAIFHKHGVCPIQCDVPICMVDDKRKLVCVMFLDWTVAEISAAVHPW